MNKVKKIFITLAITACAVYGALILNYFELQLFQGTTIDNWYVLPFVDFFIYTVWFLILASIGSIFLKPRPLPFLSVAAIAVFLSLFFSHSVWINPLSSFAEKAFGYFLAYLASFMVLPTFLFIGFVVQRVELNKSCNTSASRRSNLH